MTITIDHCGESYAGTWRHGLWKVTKTTMTEHTRKDEGSYFSTLKEAEAYRDRLNCEFCQRNPPGMPDHDQMPGCRMRPRVKTHCTCAACY